MSSTSNNDTLDAVLAKDFPGAEVTYAQQKMGGMVHLFFIRFGDASALVKGWRRMSNAIAVYFQAKMSDEFGKWNTYLFFLTAGDIPRELKYKIENDTLSSRKIVADAALSQAAIIKKYILNDDLELASRQQVVQLAEFTRNPLITKALENKQVSGKITYTAEAKEVLKEMRIILNTKPDAI